MRRINAPRSFNTNMNDLGRLFLAREAKAIVALAFRNGPIEDVHAGKRCPTCDGQRGYSRITDPEMKAIMKSAVDRVYELLCLKNERPSEYESRIRFGLLYTMRWDEPAPMPSTLMLPVDTYHAPQQKKANSGGRQLNRSAIVVTPKQPFLDWHHSIDPTKWPLTLSDLAKEPIIYLLPECDSTEEFKDRLRGAYQAIFEVQLDLACPDESAWPAHRTLAMFRQWFEFGFHSLLLDLAEEPLEDYDLRPI